MRSSRRILVITKIHVFIEAILQRGGGGEGVDEESNKKTLKGKCEVAKVISLTQILLW